MVKLQMGFIYTLFLSKKRLKISPIKTNVIISFLKKRCKHILTLYFYRISIFMTMFTRIKDSFFSIHFINYYIQKNIDHLISYNVCKILTFFLTKPFFLKIHFLYCISVFPEKKFIYYDGYKTLILTFVYSLTLSYFVERNNYPIIMTK